MRSVPASAVSRVESCRAAIGIMCVSSAVSGRLTSKASPNPTTCVAASPLAPPLTPLKSGLRSYGARSRLAPGRPAQPHDPMQTLPARSKRDDEPRAHLSKRPGTLGVSPPDGEGCVPGLARLSMPSEASTLTRSPAFLKLSNAPRTLLTSMPVLNGGRTEAWSACLFLPRLLRVDRPVVRIHALSRANAGDSRCHSLSPRSPGIGGPGSVVIELSDYHPSQFPDASNLRVAEHIPGRPINN